MAWFLGAGGVAALTGVIIANWDWYKNSPRPDLAYLSSIKLKALDGTSKEVLASELTVEQSWSSHNGGEKAWMTHVQRALELASLKPELDQMGVNLVGVVHEQKGAKGFQPYLNASIYFDEEKKFYGPEQRWMFLSGFLRYSVWKSFFRARSKGVEGNLVGEGRILGGVFVVGPGEQGILLDHKEKEFGDKVDLQDVRTAILRMKSSN